MPTPPDRVYRFASPPPFHHQTATLQRILADRGIHALLHEPGVGKSRVVVDYACILATGLDREVRVLVVCPRDVQDTWLDQFRRYAPDGLSVWIEMARGSIAEKAKRLRVLGTGGPLHRRLPGRGRLCLRRPEADSPDEQGPGPRVVVYVTNIESFSSQLPDAPSRTITLADRMVNAVRDAGLDLLVLDESHRCKGPTANAARALARAARHVPRRLLLTGTPMPHSPLDVWSQWRILDPTAFSTGGDPWGFGRFQREYAVLGGWMGREVVGFQRLDDLQARIGRRSSVVRKADALDLPPTLDVEHSVELTPAERKAYAAMKDELVARLDAGTLTTADNRLVQLLRLRQIASGYLKGDDGATVDLGPGKRAACRSLLEDLLATEHRVVVFAWGIREVELLADELRAAAPHGAAVRVITGATPDAERRAIRAEFGTEPGAERIVLVCQIRTMSLGVNELVTASHAIFLSQSQLRDDFVQACGRLDRQGQRLSVTFHHLLATDTVDEVILKAHRERGDLESLLLDHLRAEPGAADAAA